MIENFVYNNEPIGAWRIISVSSLSTRLVQDDTLWKATERTMTLKLLRVMTSVNGALTWLKAWSSASITKVNVGTDAAELSEMCVFVL